ncbi:MAG: hypothetical protein IJ781_09480, partial [Atopobiaceae bacterium]|nr:hypothetical protein [Atopobiaceae bacterium]
AVKGGSNVLNADTVFAGALQIVDPRSSEVVGVWFNPPHTTVRWGDGKTTTVKCGEGDTYDPMLGFLLCVAKHHFGGTGRYLEVMRANGVPECPKPTTIEVNVGKADYVCVSTEAWNEVGE